MAWTRLGVPPEWASFLIQLDLDGNTTVRLPISQHAYDRTGLAGLHRLQALGATDILFPAARGVPQGDVASPFGWNAVYDILLRALTIQRRTLPDPAAQAIAYADDLLSLSSTQACLQQQADLVSAFAQIFELDLAHTKFRAYEFPYHRTHAHQPATPPVTLRVNNLDIPLRQTGTLTYLGSQYDLDPKGQSQFDHHQTQLDRHAPPCHPPPTCADQQQDLRPTARSHSQTNVHQSVHPTYPQTSGSTGQENPQMEPSNPSPDAHLPCSCNVKPPPAQNPNAQRRHPNLPTPLLLA